MSWLKDIQNKPQSVKLRLIWTVCLVAVILLSAIWIISAKFSKNVPGDFSLFHTLGQGIKDFKNSYKK